MPTRKQYTKGQRFGRLTYLRNALDRGPIRYAVFRCDCGTEKEIHLHNVVRGVTKSCGCLSRETTGKMAALYSFRHGMYGTSTYVSWTSMKQRCTNPHHPHYHNYGGRGIRVCRRWLQSFKAFWLDMGTCPDGHYSVERIDCERGYSKSNCRWLPRNLQAQNRRDSSRIKYAGKTLCLSAQARRFGRNPELVRNRIKAGWSPKCALEAPVNMAYSHA